MNKGETYQMKLPLDLYQEEQSNPSSTTMVVLQ